MDDEENRNDYEEQRWEDDGGATRPDDEIGLAREIKKKLDALRAQAVPPEIAADLLGWDRASVYRSIKNREIEFVIRRKRHKWVTVRAILDELEEQYGPTAKYDVLAKLRRSKCRDSRKRRRLPE